MSHSHNHIVSRRFRSPLDQQMYTFMHSPNFDLDQAVDTEIGDIQIVQQGQDVGYFHDAGSTYAYRMSQGLMPSTLAGSSQAEPDIACFDSSERYPVDFLTVAHPSFSLNESVINQTQPFHPTVQFNRSDLSLPTALESERSNHIFLEYTSNVPTGVDNILPISAFDNHITPFETVQEGYSVSENPGHIDTRGQSSMPATNEPPIWNNLAPVIVLSSNDGGNVVQSVDMLDFTSYWHHDIEDNNRLLMATMHQANAGSPSIDHLHRNSPEETWITQRHPAATLLPNFSISDTIVPGSAPASQEKVFSQRDVPLGVAPHTSKDIPESHTPRYIKSKPVTQLYDNLATGNANKVTKRLQRGGGRGRQGPLVPEARKNAALVRIKHACKLCFLRKVTCSDDKICPVCQNHLRSPFQGKLCHRDPLQIYVLMFLPPVLMNHLHQSSVEDLTNGLHFHSTERLLALWTGRTHPPMVILVKEYVPPNEEFLRISDLTTTSNDYMQTFSTVQSLAYGMHNYNRDEIKQKCREHVEGASQLENIVGDRSNFLYQLLLAICRFLEADPTAQKGDLLHNAVMMNRFLHIMCRRIVFSDNSGVNAPTSFGQSSYSHPVPAKSARILNRQIKALMYQLLEEYTTKVLAGLDESIKQKKSGWEIVCFCTILLLYMSAGELQIALDGFAFFRSADGQVGSSQSTQSESEACVFLEKGPLDHLWTILQEAHAKILKHIQRQRSREEAGEMNQNEPITKFMEELHRLRTEHDSEITRLAAIQYSGGSSRLTIDHKKFRYKGGGRVLAKVLKALPDSSN